MPLLVRILVVLLAVYALGGAIAGVAQSSPKIGKQRVVKKDYEDLQRWVNEGHEPWREDARPVAGETILQIEHASKGSDVNNVPLKMIRETQKYAVYEYYAGKNLCYVVALQRFSWLLPLAKKWEWVVWAPTDVSRKPCELTPDGNISEVHPVL